MTQGKRTVLKSCRDCSAVLPFDQFPDYSNNRGKRPMCRKCFTSTEARKRRERRTNDPVIRQRDYENNKSYRERYSDGYIQHQLNKRKKFKSRYYDDLLFRCRQLSNSSAVRAKRKGLEHNLTGEIIYVMLLGQNYKCSITGTPFDFSQSEKYHRNPCAPSIDRKDNCKGYTLNNIQLVCAWYNMLKNEWSDRDVKAFISLAYHSMFKD